MSIESEQRPWGKFEVLVDSASHKVKRITVHSKARLSLQRHQKRREHWYFVCGTGVVTLDQQRIEVHEGSAVDIPLQAVHRIENPGESDLVFIEVQTGDYFGEDDIERLEDDYGRNVS